MYDKSNTFDFSINCKENNRKNIILIGGLNGNGKTSIIEAISLCLYDKQAKHLFKSSSYSNFVTSRFSQNALKRGETSMKISIEFEDVQELNNTLFIERTWTFATYDGKPKIQGSTKFIVKKNPETENRFPETKESEEANTFIYRLIPPEISQFFFFDGEKVQEMAEDKNYGERISKDLQDVLGISIIGKLQEDLKKVKDSYSTKSKNVTEIRKNIKEIELEIAELDDLISKNNDNISELDDEIRKIEKNIQYLKDDFQRITRENIKDRGNLRGKELELSKRQKEINEELDDILEFELPMAICANLCEELKDRLEKEEKYLVQDKEKQSIKPKLERLLLEVFDQGKESRPKLLFAQKEFYKRKISDIWYNLFSSVEEVNIDELLHDVNKKDYKFIIQQINGLSQNLLPKFKNLIQNQERKETELRNIQNSLKEENNPEISEKFKQLDSLNKEKVNKISKKERLENDNDLHGRKKETCKKSLRNFENELMIAEKTEQKLIFVRKIKDALLDYEKKLKENKLSALEKLISDMFSHLSNKKGMSKNIEIDAQTFTVSIKDEQGRIVEKHNFSAGFKQIFAFSLLWGLAQVSKFEIPIIIDTPFARLDNIHRTNIIKNYCPVAGRQVIVLSTDTEIGQHNVKLLEPYVVKYYLLERESESDPVQIKEGYFG